MFRLIQHFIKETLISFYFEKDSYKVQKRVVKHGNILSQEEFSFNEDELKNFINSCYIENTQTYVSTIIDTFNQGCVDSCTHSKYKALGINLDNIKILCLKDYSIFIGLYELNNFQKEMKKFKVDYIFSPYLMIDMNKKQTPNSLYMFYSDSFMIIVIYEDGYKPKYSNIYQFKLEEENEIEEEDSIDDEIGEIDDIDDLVEDIDEIESLDDTLEDSLDDSIEESLEDMDDLESENIQEDITDVKNEIESIEFIKNSIKDYYENYSDNFLENAYLFYHDKISNKFVESIENEIILDITDEKLDILSIINDLALKEINV